MNKGLIRFFKKAIVFIIVIVVLDISIGKTLEFFFFKMKGGETSRATYAIEKVDQDVIVFGSSRANHHYVPEVFEEQLDKSFYNVGRDGQGIIYYYSVLRSVLKRTTPQIVILDVNPDEFVKKGDSYDRLSILLPYYNRHPELHDIINMRSQYEQYKTMSNMYRFNSSALQIIVNNIVKRGKEHNKGYIPNTSVWNKSLEKVEDFEYNTIDTTKVRFMERFIRDVKKAKSKLYVFVSPTYSIYKDEPLSIKIARQVCEREGVYFQTYNQDEIFHKSPHFFKDPGHLNHEGASIYSKTVSEEILKSMQQQAMHN